MTKAFKLLVYHNKDKLLQLNTGRAAKKMFSSSDMKRLITLGVILRKQSGRRKNVYVLSDKAKTEVRRLQNGA